METGVWDPSGRARGVEAGAETNQAAEGREAGAKTPVSAKCVMNGDLNLFRV